jgi:hypothetical protein
MNEDLMTISSWILLMFIGLSLFDGVYFHLWKYRLQERNDSKFEHLTHTLRAILFIPIVILIYWIGMKGFFLWSAVLVIIFDIVTEILDVLNEKKSRETIGGLSSVEYLVHIILTTLRVTALTLAFSAIPEEAWHLNSSTEIFLPDFSISVTKIVLPGAVFTAMFHVYLILDPILVSRLERAVKSKCCPAEC